MRVDHFDSGVAKTCLAEDARVRGAYATPLQHEACPTRVWSDAVAGYKVLGRADSRDHCNDLVNRQRFVAPAKEEP